MLPGTSFGHLPAIDFRLSPTLSTQSASFQFHVRSDLHQSSQNGRRMFILGMGFVGQFFGADLKNKGWLVGGTCTSMAKKKKLDETGLDAYVFDSKDPNIEILDIMNCHTHLLVSVPPILGAGDPLLQHKELLRSRLKHSSLQWLSYLSSTSVYGDSGGALVHEDHPVNPSSELGRSRLAAEGGWLELGQDLDIPVQVFRLGGIYGPGRSAIDTILNPEPLSNKQRLRSSKHFVSRIHVADICQALVASIHKASTGRIYNIVDDDPAPREEVFTFAQNLVKKKWPGHELKSLSSETEESLISKRDHSEEKRVSNTRMKQELGVKLVYPSYESGLLDIVEHLGSPLK